MKLTPMDHESAHTIYTWKYEGQYEAYSWTGGLEEALTEMMDRRSPYYAVRDGDNELIGFFCFGSAAQPWYNIDAFLYNEDKSIDIGLGMRPDLTGKGLGLAFVNAGLMFAEQEFSAVSFGLFVRTFNQRAIRVYEEAGFKPVKTFKRKNKDGVDEFLEMRREAKG